jgi:hypothetical protein
MPVQMRVKSSKRTLRKNRMIKALDAACRKRVVQERDGETCQRCHATIGTWDKELQRPVIIQWAHIQSREYYILRWEDINSLALCDRCHVWLDNHKVLGFDWFAKKYPERWEMILRVLQGPAKTGEAFIRELYEAL